MPTDIFPTINMPVVSVIWSYNGLPAEEMETRITTICERAITTVTSDIDHIESSSLNGISVIKVYLHQGADVGRAVGTISSLCQTLLRIYPAGTTPPLITSFSASDVPVLQLGVGSKTLSEQELFDYGMNFIRTGLSGVQGASIPLPYGGKSRQVMVDLDPQALQSKGLSATDVSLALAGQNVILPSGQTKIGATQFPVQLNSTPETIEDFNNLPLKQVNGTTVYLKDVAHVRDGFAVQTNIVHQDGRRSTLLNVLKSGSASTISVVERIRAALPQVLSTVPKELNVQLIADQSVFVKAAVDGVIREAAIAAFLTALLILVLLGSWRSTFVVAISIPLSILTSIICLSLCHQTLNIMTLGGLALAVGMLVDDATVEVENIHRNMAMGKPITQAILDGAEQIAAPSFVSTLAICIVFVPVLMLTEPAKSLFVPLGMAVVFAMMFSYFLSRTLVPVMCQYLLKGHEEDTDTHKGNIFTAVHLFVNSIFDAIRDKYKDILQFFLLRKTLTVFAFLMFFGASSFLIPVIGMDFFPSVDAGQLRLHLTAPTGTRLEETERIFLNIEDDMREIIAADDLSTILDNIGIPTSGINLAYGDNITTSEFDGEILISLTEHHKTSTFEYADRIRALLKKKYPEVSCFFQPADIVSQILNAGLPAPIDIQVTGRNKKENFKIAQRIRKEVATIHGAADVTVHQITNAPQLRLTVDRTKANQLGFTQRDIASSLLISLSSSFQTAPGFWVNPENGVNYPVAVQTPEHRMGSVDAIMQTPVTSQTGSTPQLLLNLATAKQGTTSTVVNHYKIQSVFNVFANVNGRDLGGVMADVQKVVEGIEDDLPRGSTCIVRGQAQSMTTAFYGLLSGLVFALLLVYLLLVINFQSWTDPLIILMALPGAFTGILWALFATQTTFSVPALMGAIVSIGVASANSILLVTFANDQLQEGQNATAAALNAGFTRFRPVVMTASAMIIGMLPMALGLGEGGAQNAPLGRAVIGGLSIATLATLLFVPCIFAIVRRKANPLTSPHGHDILTAGRTQA
jgi:multidrug efflux pump subunit AcrB